MIFDAVWRLEADPHQRNVGRGWAAELADPVWMLGRQWQMGEHQGEDASSPVRVDVAMRATPIEPVDGQPALDPRTAPAEVLVESEPGDWWTAGRRVRLGRTVAAAAAANGTPLPEDPDLLLARLPVPYDLFEGTDFDGLALWLRRDTLGLQNAWFGTPGPPRREPVDLWDPAELSYGARLRAGPAELVVDRHDGGDLDWFSADATAPVGSSGDAAATSVTPARLRYPSAPLPRWWQIEDAAVTVGGHAPDRSRLAAVLLIDLLVNQSDDWFTFPIEAGTGEVLTLEDVRVVDSFSDSWPLAPPAGWSLFATEGLDPRSLVRWAATATPLTGPVLDEVLIGIDEDANTVWAVERVLDGRTVATPEQPAAQPADSASGRQDAFAYRPMTPIPPHWHPYVLEEVAGRRRFVQGRAADLSGATPTLLPPPASGLLFDPASGGVHPVHQLEPAAIPQDGLRIERRALLARSTTGEPLLWTQRRRVPLLVPPALALRFDVLETES